VACATFAVVQERAQVGGFFSLPIGAGVLGNNGDFYRVRDIWMSFDHHGHYPEGMHIFMESAEIDGALLSPTARQYFQVDPPRPADYASALTGR
jgi:hypothetical protein